LWSSRRTGFTSLIEQGPDRLETPKAFNSFNADFKLEYLFSDQLATISSQFLKLCHANLRLLAPQTLALAARLTNLSWQKFHTFTSDMALAANGSK